MIPASEALRQILDSVPVLGAEEISLNAAAGRVLADPIHAVVDGPPFDNSAMDGYGVRSAETASATPEKPVCLRLEGGLAAGCGLSELAPGTSRRILTGAPLPAGGDAVVMQEHTETGNGEVRIFRAVAPGANIRRAGEDLRRGDLLLGAGASLGPLQIALLSSQGVTRLRVRRRPRVAIITTGDEVVPPDAEPVFGQVRNSNGLCLKAAAESAGAVAEDLGGVGDRPEDIAALVSRGGSLADAILISGGVSVGDRDYTKSVVEGLGVRLAFWKAAIKPGKPLLFGVWSNRLVFGLPGNPVAAWLCCEEFVRPALRLMQGLPAEDRWSCRGRVDNAYPAAGGRQQYLFCRADPAGEGYSLQVIRPQSSAMMGLAARANALALAPMGLPVAPGDDLQFRWLRP